MNDSSRLHPLESRPEAILPERLSRWAEYFVRAWRQTQVDPLLLAALCDRESGGGIYLRPQEPGGTGDGGHGRGLMQIDDRSHRDFLARTNEDGVYLWTLPSHNIQYGAELLSSLLSHFTQPALRLGEQLGTHCAVAAYNCGIGGVTRGLNSAPNGSSVSERILAVDSRTTGHDYSKDVLTRYARFTLRAVSWE